MLETRSCSLWAAVKLFIFFWAFVGGAEFEVAAKTKATSCQDHLSSQKTVRAKKTSQPRPTAAPQKSTPKSKTTHTAGAHQKSTPNSKPTQKSKWAQSSKRTQKSKQHKGGVPFYTPQPFEQFLQDLLHTDKKAVAPEGGAIFTGTARVSAANNGNKVQLFSSTSKENLLVAEMLTLWFYGGDRNDRFHFATQNTSQKSPFKKLNAYRASVKKLVHWLRGHGWHLNTRQHFNQSLLHLAIVYDDESLVGALIEEGADTMAQDDFGQTPLHIAVRHKSSEEILKLLQPAVHIVDRYQKTPLHMAVDLQDTKRIEVLLNMGADPDAPDANKQSAYLKAFNSGNLNLVRLMWRQGASARAPDLDGITPLHSAVLQKNPELIKMALSSGADVNARAAPNEHSPLHLAAGQSDLASIDALVSEGADPSIQTQNGYSAWALMLPWIEAQDFVRLTYQTETRFENLPRLLVAAIASRRHSLLDFIISQGADTSLKFEWAFTAADANGQPQPVSDKVSLLFLALTANKDFKAEAIKRPLSILLKHINPNTYSENYGLSPLFLAAFLNNDVAVELLLQRDADINYNIGEFGTALHVAVRHHSNDAVARLLAYGADPNIQHPESGATALHAAIQAQNKEAAQYILQNPLVKTNLLDAQGLTALKWAKQHKLRDMELFLLHTAPHQFANEAQLVIQ